jgi:hypothetical protein
MQISKYLTGDTKAQLQNEDAFLIDESLQDWLISQAVPDDFVELNGERISIDDPRIFHSLSLRDTDK